MINLRMNNQKGVIHLPLIVIVIAVVVGWYLSSQSKNIPTFNQHTQDDKTTQNPTSDAKIMITRDGFIPATITVSKGQQITWINTDTNRYQIAPVLDNTTNDEDLASFESDELSANDQFSFTFEKEGAFKYKDNKSNILGVITVR